MKTRSAAGLLLAALCVCAPAQADATADPTARNEQTDDAAVALAAGGGVQLLSLGTGAVMVARGSDRSIKNAGFLGAQVGMVFAPLAAHAVVGETGRGLWFSLPLLVPVATTSVTMALAPNLIKRADAGVQYVSYLSFMLSIVGGTIGVLDAVRVGERRKPADTRAGSFSVTPLFGNGLAGALLSGSL